MSLPAALEITGPLPAIASAHLSLPTGMTIAVPRDQFPAGYNLSAVLDTRNVEASSTLVLGCAEGIGKPVSIQVGEQNAKYSLQRLSSDQLFVSADTSEFPAGCRLEAKLMNGRTGESKPFALAQLIRLPEIQSFEPGSQAAPDGQRSYVLTGRNLEMIEKAGWDQLGGPAVATLPTPIPGQGQKQALNLVLPDPAPPHANLYVWLRGEKDPCATTLNAPAMQWVPP